MDNIKSAIAKNIAELRLEKGLTQLELAEKLNYSDKAISKWERGESVPDVAVLAEISKLFGVSLDYLITLEHTPEKKFLDKAGQKIYRYSKPIIVAVSVLFVWFIAVCAFVIISLVAGKIGCSWLSFIYALPISAIVWLVLNSIWLNRKSNYFIISLLMWSFLLSIHLTLLMLGMNIWLIYFIGIPAQIIIILWSCMKRKNK